MRPQVKICRISWRTSNLDGPARFPVSWAGPGWFPRVARYRPRIHGGLASRRSDPRRRGRRPLLRTALAARRSRHRGARDSACVPRRARESRSIARRRDSRAERADRGRSALENRAGRWTKAVSSMPSAKVTMSDDAAWRLFFNALPLVVSAVGGSARRRRGARCTAAARAIGDRLSGACYNEPWRGAFARADCLRRRRYALAQRAKLSRRPRAISPPARRCRRRSHRGGDRSGRQSRRGRQH